MQLFIAIILAAAAFQSVARMALLPRKWTLFLALLVFLALSYNLHFLADPEQMTPYEMIRGRLSAYGLKGNLYVGGLTALFWLWFRFFGDHALFSSRPLTAA